MIIESMDRMFLPVGQGAFYCERFYGAEQGRNLNVVYDCGTLTGRTYQAKLELIRKVVDRNFQDTNDKIIDAVFISHLHEDHFNGLEYLVKKCKIRRIYLPQTDPLELKLMQLYYVAHHTALESGRDSLGGHFLECNDLERDFPEALRKVMPDGDGRTNNVGVPYVVSIGKDPINVSDTIFKDSPAGIELEGGFAKWKYMTFCIKNVEAIQRVEDGLKQLIRDKRKIDVSDVTSEHVAELIKDCRADKLFRREIRRVFKRAIDDFHANSLVLFSGCDNMSELYAHFGVLPCNSKSPTRFCWMFTDAVGCLYTGDFKAKNETCWNQLKDGFNAEWTSIGCVQIPHHGSINNYNDEFLAMTPWHVVSAGENSKHHPHQEVREKYKDRCPLIVVTEDMSSLAEWRIEEKSSSGAAVLLAYIHTAATKRWCKVSGASPSFMIFDKNGLPLWDNRIIPDATSLVTR